MRVNTDTVRARADVNHDTMGGRRYDGRVGASHRCRFRATGLSFVTAEASLSVRVNRERSWHPACMVY